MVYKSKCSCIDTWLIHINDSVSGKINALLNLINEQDYIDKIYLYAKDLSEYEILI